MRRSLALLLTSLLATAFATYAAARDPYGNAGMSRRYSPYDSSARSYRQESPAYAASRRAVDPYTPYYNRPAVWPYYPGYYGSWFYGPYGYRYGFAPWYAPYGPYRWRNSWSIYEVGPASPSYGYAWRVPYMPYEPGTYVAPADVGRGFPAVPTAEASEECYYW
jgi:hypothetical protein